MLANTKYTYQHNQVAKYIRWWILKDLGSNVKDMWQEHTPGETIEIKNVTVMWDTAIIGDKKVQHNRPDIVIHDKKDRTCVVIDV